MEELRMAKDRHVLAAAVAAPEPSRVEKVKEEMKTLFGVEARGVTAVAASALVVTCTVAVRSLREENDESPPPSEPSQAAALDALIAERKRQLQAARHKVGTRPPMEKQTVTLRVVAPSAPSPAKAPSASTGTQPPPPAQLPLPRAKLEALEANARQWGTQTMAASTGTQPPPPSKLQPPNAKLEALEVNARQWGTQTTGGEASTPVPGAFAQADPDALVDFKARLDSIAKEAKFRIDTMTIERIQKARED